MKILITGGRGFLAGKLLAHFSKQQASGYEIAILSRKPGTVSCAARTLTTFEQAAEFHADVIINLAGASLFDKRWTTARQQEMYKSRVDYTDQLLSILEAHKALPSTLLSGSAVGYYGDTDHRITSEIIEHGNDWSAKLCADWEAQALAYSNKMRVCILRTGLVMHPSGGALKPLALPAKAGLLGPFGNGDNFWSWISLTDWLNAVTWLIEQPTCQGAFNLTAPEPLTQKEFMKALSRSVSRPSFFSIPRFGVKALMGIGRGELLMASQRVVPSRLLDGGFEFVYTEAQTMLDEYAK